MTNVCLAHSPKTTSFCQICIFLCLKKRAQFDEIYGWRYVFVIMEKQSVNKFLHHGFNLCTVRFEFLRSDKIHMFLRIHSPIIAKPMLGFFFKISLAEHCNNTAIKYLWRINAIYILHRKMFSAQLLQRSPGMSHAVLKD